MALECTFGALANVDQSDPDAIKALLDQCTATLLDPVIWSWALGITLGCAIVGALIGLAKGRWLAGLLYDHFAYYAPAFATGIGANILNLLLVGILVGRQRLRLTPAMG